MRVYDFVEYLSEHIQIPLVHIKNGDLVEEKIDIVVDKEGRVIQGPYPSVQDAYHKALESLSNALGEVENVLDALEYRLEMEEPVKPGEIYTASYMAHALYYYAAYLYQLGRELGTRGMAPPRLLSYARALRRKALFIRRYARDVRLLHATVVQLSLDASMKRLTWLGTVALPAIVITGFYGMNLDWLPLADNPPAVFLILASAVAAFAYILNKI
ncbi:CorA family divalent cation transporter [Pyrobaculum sp.]|uniref:CorA family divalent cation transporter n=1 Tax=Pyrobaculum sp. TaxID=2004705 RepID=UPI00316F5B1E